MNIWKKTKRGFEYCSVNEWKYFEDQIHQTFYRADGNNWHSGFAKLIRKWGAEYTEQHDCLKFMNE